MSNTPALHIRVLQTPAFKTPALKAMEPHWPEIPWEQALRVASLPIARVLEKSLDGGTLDFEEGLALAAVEGDDLLALVKVADAAKFGIMSVS